MTEPAAPTPTEMPQIDRLRLEMVTFLYAAAVGYGFAVLDAAPWVFQPTSWSQAGSSLAACWPALFLYLWVFVFIAFDWLFVRNVYFKENAYRKWDFIIDIVIVFFFVRMMHAAVNSIDKTGNLVNLAYWWWLGLVFFAYLVWDGIRICRAFKILRGQPNALRDAIKTQKLSLLVDVTALVIFACVFSFSPPFQEWFWVAVLVFGSPIVYGIAAWVWWRDS